MRYKLPRVELVPVQHLRFARPNRMLAAVAQMCSTADRAANFRVITELAERAAKAGARMLFLPECAHILGDATISSVEAAEPLDGPSLKQFSELAARHKLWMSVGSFPEAAPTAGKVYNSQVILDDCGRRVAVYRKVHLFDYGALRESDYTEAGTQLVVVDTPLGKLGLTTCYDIRFPGQLMALRAAGAELLSCPAAFTERTGAAHWELLLRSAAANTQCYVLAAAQAGKHNDAPGRSSWGHAMCVDPWGAVKAQAGESDVPGLLLTPIDASYLTSVRTRMPLEEHAKPAVYAAPVLQVPMR